MKKVTQIDYQILVLENMGSNMSAIEKLKLSNLKEQKTLMAKQGIELKASLVLPRFLPPSRKTIQGDSSQSLGSKEVVVRKLESEESMEGADGATMQVKEASIEKLSSVLDEEELSMEVNENDNNTKAGAWENNKRKKPSGQGISSSFLMFVQHERENLNKADPHAKLNLPALRQTWSKMRVDEKKVFQDMVGTKKVSLGQEFRKDIKNKSLSEVEK